jgi:hypothetical protein
MLPTVISWHIGCIVPKQFLPCHGTRNALIVVSDLEIAPHRRSLPRRDPHGSVKQVHHKELKDGEKERPSAFPKIMLKQTDSGIQQLAPARERA